MMTAPRMLAVTAAAIAAIAAPSALGARTHHFTGTYTGTGNGVASGNTASGSGTAAGRGTGIGASTLNGSAKGVFISRTCVAFDGTAVLKGTTGSIRLAAHGARACATTTDGSEVSFSGSAKVAGGAGLFAHAHGTLSFSGTYARQSGVLSISFRGTISY
jgi:hypothetical protein